MGEKQINYHLTRNAWKQLGKNQTLFSEDELKTG